MDAANITDLPASAQRVLAGHLRPSDAGNCRVASSLLSGVASDLSNTRLWIVGSTFRRQIEDDAYCGRSSAFLQGDDCSQMQTDQTSVPYGDLCTAASLARAAQGVVRAEVLVDASEPCDAMVWHALFSALLSSTSLRELTVTEYCAQHSTEVEDAVASRQIGASSGFSWSMAQQCGVKDMHVSSSSTIGTARNTTLPLTAADCAWLPPLVVAANSRAVQQGPAAAGVTQQQQQQAEGCEQGQQTGQECLSLKLQLLGPLQPQDQLQLLQLQGLVGLSVVKTPTWLAPHLEGTHADPSPPLGAGGIPLPEPAGLPGRTRIELSQIQPVLPTPLLRQLRGLGQLSSLDCTVGPPMMHKEKPAEVGTMLQQLLLDMGSQLTQLTIGPQSSTPPLHYILTAPLRMPALRSLTCKLGFSLDVETDINDTAMQQMQLQVGPQPTAAAAAVAEPSSIGDVVSNSSGSDPGTERKTRAAAAPAALLPSLTRLVLLDRACVPDVLQHLGESEAACSQLQHLQIPQLSFEDEDDAPDYNAYNDQQQPRQDPGVGSLQQLEKLVGLRELQLHVCGQQQLDVLVAGLGQQLQGLTVFCYRSNPLYVPIGTPSSACQVQLQSLFKGMPHLTSLKVVGGTGAMLDPQQDLPTAAQHLTALRSLSYTGRIIALPNRGFELLPGMLPSTLQGLTIVARQSASAAFDADGVYTLNPGCFPQGLTSLKCRGFCWQRPGDVEPWSPWFGWEFLPSGLKQLELEAEAPCMGAGPSGILPVSSTAAVTGVTAQELSGDASASAAEAAAAASAACGSTFEAPPTLVELPALESVALHMHANRLGGDLDDADRLPLAALLGHLSGLSSLTNLHISSKVTYWPGDCCKGLSGLVSLKVLALDLALSTERHSDAVPFTTQSESFKEFVRDLSHHLAPSCGLRVLRLPLPNSYDWRGSARMLEHQLPNCLLVEADDTFLEDSSMID